MIFRAIVSLGEDCEVAHQLRRYFDVKRAGMFDWWIVPLPGLVRLLEDGTERLFEPDDLEPIDGGEAIASRRYGLVFHHDFRRDANGLVDLGAVASQLPEVRAKHQALWQRLEDDCLSGGPVLLVRERRRLAAPVGEGDDAAGLAALRSAAMARWPAADLRFLFLGYAAWFAAENVLFDSVADSGDIFDWSGSALGWDAVMQRNRIQLHDHRRWRMGLEP